VRLIDFYIKQKDMILFY